MRIEELGRSVVFLTRENQELREQNEIFRQMVVSHEFFLFYIFLFLFLQRLDESTSSAEEILFAPMDHKQLKAKQP